MCLNVLTKANVPVPTLLSWLLAFRYACELKKQLFVKLVNWLCVKTGTSAIGLSSLVRLPPRYLSFGHIAGNYLWRCIGSQDWWVPREQMSMVYKPLHSVHAVARFIMPATDYELLVEIKVFRQNEQCAKHANSLRRGVTVLVGNICRPYADHTSVLLLSHCCPVHDIQHRRTGIVIWVSLFLARAVTGAHTHIQCSWEANDGSRGKVASQPCHYLLCRAGGRVLVLCLRWASYVASTRNL